MRQATVGSILINNLLPEDLRDYRKVWNKKETAKTLTQLARRYPEQYKEISHRLLQYGYDFAYRTGGQSFGLADIHESEATKAYREKIQQDTQAILARNYAQGRESDDPKVQKEIANMLAGYYPKLTEDAMAEKVNSPFYRQAYGTGAQKPGTYNSIIGADLRYEDAHGKLVPIPVTRGYAKGLSPAEYIAGTYGGRKGIVDLQKATMSAGAFSKQLVQMAHREVVTADDDPRPYDESTPRGYPSEIDDPDNEGAYLAHPVAGYKRNTLLTPEVIADIKKQGVKDILVRSVIVGGPEDGGIYAYDAGVREKGTRPYLGDYVGISAVQALSEPLTQSAISCLHPGTRVRMGDGSIKKLRDMQVGDVVMGSDSQGHLAPTTVTHVFHNGVQPVYRTSYRYGNTNNILNLYATLEHRILQMTRKSSCCGEIYNGIPRVLPTGYKCRHITAVLSTTVAPRVGVVEPGAFLLGLLLGDGCYTKSVLCVPHLSCNDKAQVEAYAPYLKSIGLRLSFHKGSQCYYRVVGYNNSGNGNNTPNPARKLLAKYDMLGKYSYEKVIPSAVSTWSTASVLDLLSGLWDSDGSIFTTNQAKHAFTSYASTSYRMIRRIRDLIELHIGAHATAIYPNNTSRKRTLYTLTYSNPVEVLKLLTALRLHGAREEKRQAALPILQETVEQLTSMRKFFYCKRQSQEFFGNVETIDLEVDNQDHLYVLANGLIVHNSKHSGGVVGAASAKAISGFSYINQLVQVPKHFPNGATHATVEGRVTDITRAPQGGTFVWIDGVKHYVEPTRDGADNELKVKRGDFVEAGDAISSGIPNPATIVRYKGIGEGRRAFIKQFGSALRDAGISVHRRNIEALSRGLISYVRLTDEMGDYSPEDVLPYTYVASHYKPRKDAIQGNPKNMKGMYLEKPVLHYTVGTRLQPSVIRELQKFNVQNVVAHKAPPPFEPEMIRAMAHVSKDTDWGTRMLGGYNKDSLLEAARLGSSSYLEGTSFVPALAFGGDKFKPDQRRADMIPTLSAPRFHKVIQDGE